MGTASNRGERRYFRCMLESDAEGPLMSMSLTRSCTSQAPRRICSKRQ
jgi:hypothetical protein